MSFKNIRPFTKNDIDRVMEIWYSSSIDTYDFIAKKHWDEIKGNVRNKFLNSNIYVYEESNIIKAFILFDDDYIDELYVDKKYRSLGIGKILLDFVKSFNLELTLNIFQKNERAIEFYKNNGFKIIEENIEESTNEKGYFMKWKRK